jgi:pyruvate ferredoxin oxidoreductase beta subunit
MADRLNTSAKELSNSEYFYGHRACAGCGGSLALRLAMKVLGP